ncbi:MAG: methionyl-tRNA synthetase, partial [Bacteroides sp. SM23_62_1]
PDTARKLVSFLNISPVKWADIGSKEILKPGHQINQPELLFEKIEDPVIQAQLDKLENIKKMNESAASGLEPALKDISFEEFSTMDIRTAVILEAEKVPNTDKLLKVVVDTGLDIRTVITGIAECFKPEELPGKQVCVLANLAPRTIRGIESHGMILLAEEPGGKFIFITPEEKTKPGSVVK